MDQLSHLKQWFSKLKHIISGEPSDKEEVLAFLEEANERDLLSNDALSMIDGVLDVAELKVRDVMLPRSQIVTLEEDDSLAKVLPIIIETAHSRYPVMDENKDKITGILLAKDILSYLGSIETTQVSDIARGCNFVPEGKRLDILLKEFRANRQHMAIVVDEYGGVAGLITIEDILEQIVGDIEDEYDDEGIESHIKPLDDHHYLVNALTPVTEINQYFDMALDEEEFDTIGGVIAQNMGRIPQAGETCELDQCEVTIQEATPRKICWLKFAVKH